MMKGILFTLTLLLYSATSFAQKQNTETKHPCLLPVLELHNEIKEKLTEGTIPNGKITMRLQKNQACTESVKYEVLRANLIHVRGFRPVATVDVNGNVADLSEMGSKFVPGDRLYMELKVRYTTSKGKTGETTFSHNWVFKETKE
ncbi:hypothetical protein WG947_09320 [Pontibacter sp. H259]|uniref:hypothetical protein n=1 Tax=Pontibacter sp. H259 TaxID=3133421 RepID=UPI0030BCD772